MSQILTGKVAADTESWLSRHTISHLVVRRLASRECVFDHRKGAIIGTLMNTRALMELIALNIGFDLGFILDPFHQKPGLNT